MPNKTATEILADLDQGKYLDKGGVAEAARQLFEMMMECVGEDEIPDPGTTWGGRHTRNGLRAEIRTKLIEVFKQEEK